MRRFQALLLAVLVLVGCTSDSSTSVPPNAVGTGTITVVHDEVSPRAVSSAVDTLEFRGFDGEGKLVFGWTRQAFASSVVLEEVPREVVRLHIDYLRNAGFRLQQVDVPVDLSSGVASVLNPPFEDASADTSTWSITTSGTPGTSSAAYALNVSQPQATASPAAFRIKGVCYSPSPINNSNKNGPNIGDYFFDNVTSGGNVDFYNWFGLWGPADVELANGYYARGDVDDIRTNLGANSIRVYGMISRQLNSDTMQNGGFVTMPAGYHYTHQKFLDTCWNNGNDPLYVLVGIPMSAACFDSDVAPMTNEVAFWEYVLQETVSDVGAHPAVLGFTIMNEEDQAPDAFPSTPATDSSSPATNYFYGQAMAYAATVKQNAPGKLVGWAIHDSNNLVGFASTQTPDATDPAYANYGFVAGQPYFAQLTDFDYWGVNTYQTSSLDSLVSPTYPHPMPDTYNSSGSYGALSGGSAKPLIFTEMGWPATGHDPVGQPGPAPGANLYYLDASPSPSPSPAALPPTGPNTAATITTMYGLAYASNIVLGAFYFEYADEWWAQGDPGDEDYAWDASAQDGNAPQFPNGWWDQEGFGLYSTARTSPRMNTDSNTNSSGPILPLDTYTRRPAIFQALQDVFSSN